jgi:hypothetical protein
MLLLPTYISIQLHLHPASPHLPLIITLPFLAGRDFLRIEIFFQVLYYLYYILLLVVVYYSYTIVLAHNHTSQLYPSLM